MCLKRKASAIAHRTNKTQTALRRVKYPAPLRLTRMAISGVLMVALIFTMNLNRQKRRKRRSSSSIIPHEKKQTGSPLNMSGYEDDAKPSGNMMPVERKLVTTPTLKRRLDFD